MAPENAAARIALVTGTTSGIGAVLARELAGAGMVVLAHARTAERAQATADLIRSLSPGASVIAVSADLGSLNGVDELATQAIAAAPNGIDVLIHNAGAAFAHRRLSPDGVEATIAVNHLAVAALSDALIPGMTTRSAATGRHTQIMAISSYLEKRSSGPLDWTYPNRYSQLTAYIDSKHLGLAYLYRLAREIDGSGVLVNAADPGSVRTEFQRKAGGPLRIIGLVGGVLMSSPERGARTALGLATDVDLTATGGYFRKGRPADSSPHSRDVRFQDEVWERTRDYVGLRPGRR